MSVVSLPRLVGTAEIAAMLGVTRQRAQQLEMHPSFPSPVYRLGCGRIWLEAEVAGWAESRGRAVTVSPNAGPCR